MRAGEERAGALRRRIQAVPTEPLFISGVQKELQDERRAVMAFAAGDPLLRRDFTVFLFEDLPAATVAQTIEKAGPV